MYKFQFQFYTIHVKEKGVRERKRETISLPLFRLFSIQVVNRLPIGNSLFWCITFADMSSPNSERICAMWYKQTCSSSKYTNFQRIIIYLGTWRFIYCIYTKSQQLLLSSTMTVAEELIETTKLDTMTMKIYIIRVFELNYVWKRKKNIQK